MTIQNVLNRGSIQKNAARLDRVNELAFIEYATNKAVESTAAAGLKIFTAAMMTTTMMIPDMINLFLMIIRLT